MKNNQRRLMAVLKMIGYKNLISASFGKYDCTIIANYSPEFVATVLRHKFIVNEKETGQMLLFNRGNVRIAIS
jgi:hypothetical protein